MYKNFAILYDELMNDVDYKSWANYIQDIFLQNNINQGASVLDCACGTGNITVELQKKQYKTIGIDLSQEMLNVAAKKARENSLNINFICQDMKKLSLHKKVDVINCSCDGVNYLSGEKDLEMFLKASKNVLEKKGIICFDISSKYKLKNILGINTFAQTNDNNAYIWQNMYDDSSDLIEMKLTFFNKTSDINGLQKQNCFQKFCETHIQKAFNEKTIVECLEKVGFSNIKVYEAFGFDKPEQKSERLQFVAQNI